MNFSIQLGSRLFEINSKRSMDIPDAYTPVDGPVSYSFQPSTGLDRHFEKIIEGLNCDQNLLTLSESVPEIFAPINEIATRVQDAEWQLKKIATDEIVYDNAKFNQLFSNPNPVQTFKQLIYEAVFYEILTGKQFFYANVPEILDWSYKNVGGLFNWPAQNVRTIYKPRFNLYTSTELADIVDHFELDGIDYTPGRVACIQGINLRNKQQPLDGKSILRHAKKAISNLIAVYEARGVIYTKRGMVGMIVNKQQDASGAVALTAKEKKELRAEVNKNFGLSQHKDLISISDIPVEYINMAMSIKDMEPFRETLADASVIYAVLGVPQHLVPSEQRSTFDNADADLKKLYTSVVIPKANQYADVLGKYLGYQDAGFYIYPSFKNVELLQSDAAKEADTLSKNVITYKSLYDDDMITKNDYLIGIGREPIKGWDFYKSDAKNDSALATKLGVGGTQALQSIISDPNIGDKAKVKILEVLFNIPPADASGMIQTPVAINV